MSADISTREGLFAVMRQIAVEREAAKPLVAELIAREEWPSDEDIPEQWKTAGFVEVRSVSSCCISRCRLRPRSQVTPLSHRKVECGEK